MGTGTALTHLGPTQENRSGPEAMGEDERRGAPGSIEVIEARAGVTVVKLLGEHDLAGASDLDFLLESLVGANRLVVVDLSDATFLDSSILLALVRADQSARARGATFRLQFGTAPIVKRALELTGLLDQLESARTREEAVREEGDCDGAVA